MKILRAFKFKKEVQGYSYILKIYEGEYSETNKIREISICSQ